MIAKSHIPSSVFGEKKRVVPSGWLRRYLREDARNGYVRKAEAMSRRGILAWDPNSRLLVPYYPPPYRWLYGGREAWNKSVPFYQPLIDRLGVYGEGEFQAHWMDMLFRQAFVAGVAGFKDWARRCVRDLLDGRDDSGYLGVDLPQVRFTGAYITPFGLQNGDFEISGMGAIFDALLTYHRFTGDKKVLQAVVKAADLMLERTRGKETLGHNGGALMVNPLAKLYALTSDLKYLRRAKFILHYCRTKQIPEIRSSHCAAVGIYLLALLDLFRATGDKKLLAEAEEISDIVTGYALQSHGAPTGHGENLVPAGPNVNTEGCDIAWWTWVWIEMTDLTRDARCADLAETAIFNALPAARSEDGSASPYFIRPNQLFAVRGSGQGTVFGARLLVECCLGNLGRVLPVWSERLIRENPTGGFDVLFYAPGRFDFSRVTFIQKTDYPFADTVRIAVRLKKTSRFPVRLRIPGWCKNPILRINHRTVPIDRPCTTLDRVWQSGDRIDLTLPMDVTVAVGADGLATVRRGPLLFALPVKGRRIPADEWGSFEQIVTSRDRWNYALVLDEKNPAASFRLQTQTVPRGAFVWQYSPIALRVPAVRLNNWTLTGPIEKLIPSKSTDIPEPLPPKRPFSSSGRIETITLVPFGFTRLRMTHLPVIIKKQPDYGGS